MKKSKKHILLSQLTVLWHNPGFFWAFSIMLGYAALAFIYQCYTYAGQDVSVIPDANTVVAFSSLSTWGLIEPVFCFLLVVFTSIIALLSNSISLGVVAAFLLSCVLIIQTLSQSQRPFTLFFNPFSFPSIGEGTVWKNAAIKFSCLFAEAAAVWLVCRWIVQKKIFWQRKKNDRSK